MDRKVPPTKLFCLLPWMQIFSGLKGSFQICCHSVFAKEFVNDEDEVLFSYKHDIEDVWNCKSIRDIRMRMLEGKINPDCDHCFMMEKKAGISPRLDYFSSYYDEYLRLKESGVFEATLLNNGKTRFNPRYLSINLGNKCNLSCRMCSPHSSTVKAKELFHSLSGKRNNICNDDYMLPHDSINISKEKISGTSWQTLFNEFQESFDYANEKRYWDQIEKCIPYLQFLVIHGGEPILYKKEIESIIDKIKGQRRNRKIHLAFVTNLTLDNYDFLRKLIDIDWIILHVVFSIDGYKKLQEYIRYPLKWEIFDRNLRMLLKLSDKIDISASLTVQAYNVYYLPVVLDYLETLWNIKQHDINFSFLKIPSFLKTDVLPRNIREQAIVKLKDFIKRSKSINDKDCFFQLKNNLEIVIEDLRDEDESIPERRMEFVNYTKTLDKLRGQNILDVCPEMKSLFT